MDAEGTPGQMTSSQLADTVSEVIVDAPGATARTARLAPQPFDALLSVVSAPASQSPISDPEDLTEIL